jgi:hypothetical protein
MPDGNGIAAGAAHGGVISTAAKGPGFAFTQEQLQSLSTKWEDLADGYRDGLVSAQVIASAEGPGAEYASGDNAQLVRGSGDALWETLKARERFCRDQAEKYRAASGAYAATDDDATADVTKQEGKF